MEESFWPGETKLSGELPSCSSQKCRWLVWLARPGLALTMTGGDWTWGHSGDLVPMEYGWHRQEPNLVGKSCGVFTFHDGGCEEDCIGMKDEPCDMYYPFICQKPME